MSINSKIVNKALNDIASSGFKNMPSYVKLAQRQLSELKNSEVKEVFQNLYEKAFVNKTIKFRKISENLPTIAQKVDMVENPEIKKELITTLQDLAKKDKKGFKQSYEPQMQYVEDLADAVNVLNDKYQRLDSNPAEYYRLLNKKESWYTDLIEGRKGGPVTYRCRYTTQSGQIPYETYLKEYDKNQYLKLPEVFKKDLQLASFRKFYDKYITTKPDVVETLYNTEYLKTVNPDVRQTFKEIKKEFGTGVICSNANTTQEDANYIKEEFKLWKSAGGKEARFPYLVDVDALNPYLHIGGACGATLPSQKIVLLDLLGQDTLSKGCTLRHEMTHLNDGVPNNEIIRLIEKLKWTVLKKLHKNKWDKALDRAGIVKESHRKYALTSPLELKAVTSEARDYDSLPDGFLKDIISRFKMPYWIFEMKQNPVRENRLRNDFVKNI